MICVRVTTAEAAAIAERAGAARMTKGGYIRRRALGQPVREAAVHRLGARERVELHRNRREPQPDRPGLELRGFGAGERRVKNNARRRAGEEVVRIPWNRPLHWARFRREGMQPGQARRATGPAGEDRVDMTAWRRAEAQLWENAEDRRWLEFWRLESRARKEWAELHKRQEDTRRTLDRESRTVLGRLRIWRTGRSFAGAGRGGPWPGGPGRGLARGSGPAP